MSDLRRSHEDFLCDELFDWAFGDDEDDLNEAFLQALAELSRNYVSCNSSILGSGSVIYNKLRPPQPNPLSLTTLFAKLHSYVCVAKNTTVALQNYTMALQELEPQY